LTGFRKRNKEKKKEKAARVKERFRVEKAEKRRDVKNAFNSNIYLIFFRNVIESGKPSQALLKTIPVSRNIERN
jgi:hypothetical protein